MIKFKELVECKIWQIYLCHFSFVQQLDDILDEKCGSGLQLQDPIIRPTKIQRKMEKTMQVAIKSMGSDLRYKTL